MSCRIIHTADWHLGNKLHSCNRKKEFQVFLDWLKTEIKKQKADTLIVAGDIFDTVNPPVDSRTQYAEFFAGLYSEFSSNKNLINVIIVGGNHDSGSLLNSEKELFELLNVHVVGSLANLEPSDMVFELKNKEGEVTGICCAIPYGHEVELRKYCPEEVEKGTFHDVAYGELYRQVAEAADKLRNGRNIPVIATGHLYAANLEGRFAKEEKESSSTGDGKRSIDGVVGNLGSVHSEIFPEVFDYVALGHIHYSTMVAKKPKIRYSGSPFILGFDEHNISHGVLLVDVEKSSEPKVKKIDAPVTVNWLRLTGTSSELKLKLEEIINNPPEKETNIEICYTWEEQVDINEFLFETIESLPESTAVVHFKRNENQNLGTASAASIDELDDENITSEEIFKALISSKYIFSKDGLDEKALAEKEKEILDTYLPMLMQAAKEFDEGARCED